VTNIPHALHMPGHIYSQTGKWDDAVKSFSDAAVNERGWMKEDKLYGDGHHGHNVHYLATSYSFSGRFDEALKAAREILDMPENPGQKAQVDLMTTAHAQGFAATLRTLVQFQKWDLIVDGKSLPEYGKPRQESWRPLGPRAGLRQYRQCRCGAERGGSLRAVARGVPHEDQPPRATRVAGRARRNVRAY
jgi:hypothetical protein